MATPVLTPDELLTTTRAVRKRLDLSRTVDRTLIDECLRIAQQAPTALNEEIWHFVVVTDPSVRVQLAQLYRRGYTTTIANPSYSLNRQMQEQPRRNSAQRVLDSAAYLAEHLHEVPVHLIPCVGRRPESLPLVFQATIYGSVLQATWSFMLAARARGLGTCWTTLHLLAEREAADVLGIPFETVAQVGLIPVAHYKGTHFAAAKRDPLRSRVHWDTW
jgi:nitroreductase